jgi:hypothetical protein
MNPVNPQIPTAPSAPSYLFAGVTSIGSTLLSYPFTRVKEMLQTKNINFTLHDKAKYTSLLDALKKIRTEEGWFGFLRGSTPAVFHASLSRLLQFYIIAPKGDITDYEK